MMAYINHRSPFLSLVTHESWQVCQKAAITLCIIHRPSVDNGQVDLVSRWRWDTANLKLNPRFFKHAEDRRGSH